MPTRAWLSLTGGLLIILAAVDDPLRGEQPGYRVATFCTSAPTSSARTIRVSTGAELQTALDKAAAGDTILLAAGSIFQPPAPGSSFVLRRRQGSGDGEVTIRSADASFDRDGARPPF